MWNITQINASTPSQTSITFGGLPGKETVGPTNRLGPEGAVYVVCFPGLGYIKLTDVAHGGSGPGSWRVAVSGSSTHWSYEGDGQCKISVESDGTYTISGGSNTVNGSVTKF
ncbi:hypothetical protein DFH08DRAFT_907615 [Mycena albidolilacea]|uniref:Uncharacterized protein n=1 Tax=Mycena albidolilacea TaxID=1033008 RepID=A0AAD7E6Q6_9AGAR|nr:hypothetical protein DFH08DRAFT_907615 [Mycena albidolilacea]